MPLELDDAPPGYRALRLSAGFRASAARGPNRPAIISDAGVLTYGALTQRLNRVANAAVGAWRLSRGDIVALIAPNCAEYVEIVAGLSDVGVIVATLNPRASAAELRGILADCAPKLVLIDPKLEALMEASRAAGAPTLALGEPYERTLAAASDRIALKDYPETDSFSICYTSGTTGAPKGVLLSHRSRALTFLGMGVEYGCFGADDRFLALAPLCHGAGFAFAGAALSFGGACVLYNHAEPDRIVGRLCEGDVSGVFMVPTHFNRIFAAPAALTTNLRGRHRLKTIISNAAALAQPLKVKTVAAFGEGLLHETYGSTEAGVVTNIRPADILKKPGSVGVPFVGTDVEIRRVDGVMTAPGEIGELFSRAPYTFNGYLHRAAETAETIKNGWVSVGDLAARDADGYITICGRMKDMIVSGGVNIYPAEIETVISRHPGVAEVAVVGLPDDEWGERLHAFIVPNGGRRPDEADIVNLCRRELSSYKAPRGVTFIDELPRNVSGKILKRELREHGAVKRRVAS